MSPNCNAASSRYFLTSRPYVVGERRRRSEGFRHGPSLCPDGSLGARDARARDSEHGAAPAAQVMDASAAMRCDAEGR